MFARVTLVLAALAVSPVAAQAPTPYGSPIELAQARKMVAAAEAEAVKNKWPVAIAIVDGSGHLVAFDRLDGTQLGSIEVALQKAKCAAMFRRSTKVFEEALEKGGVGLRVLKAPHIIPIEGGLPIVVDGKVIGAIGVSGVTSEQDGKVAQAGLDALKAKP
jgi:glc operon protein GlcG